MDKCETFRIVECEDVIAIDAFWIRLFGFRAILRKVRISALYTSRDEIALMT